MKISLKECSVGLFLIIYVIFVCFIRFIRAGPGAQGVLDRGVSQTTKGGKNGKQKMHSLSLVKGQAPAPVFRSPGALGQGSALWCSVLGQCPPRVPSLGAFHRIAGPFLVQPRSYTAWQSPRCSPPRTTLEDPAVAITALDPPRSHPGAWGVRYFTIGSMGAGGD